MKNEVIFIIKNSNDDLKDLFSDPGINILKAGKSLEGFTDLELDTKIGIETRNIEFRINNDCNVSILYTGPRYPEKLIKSVVNFFGSDKISSIVGIIGEGEPENLDYYIYS